MGLDSVELVMETEATFDVEIPNVAGPRVSGQLGIEAETARFLIRLLSRQ